MENPCEDDRCDEEEYVGHGTSSSGGGMFIRGQYATGSVRVRHPSREHLNAVLGEMGDRKNNADEDVLRRAWQQLRRGSDATSLATFEGFLGGVLGELREVRGEQMSLERVVQLKSEQQEEHIYRLCDEVETQLRTERERNVIEEKRKENTLRKEVEREMAEKDKQLQEILLLQKELANALKQLNAAEAGVKEENSRLRKEKDDLEQQLEFRQMELSSLKESLEKLNLKSKEERQKRAKAVLHATESVALERESLVKQLDILKCINSQLRDERDIRAEEKIVSQHLYGEISEVDHEKLGTPPNLTQIYVKAIDESTKQSSHLSDYSSMSSQFPEVRTSPSTHSGRSGNELQEDCEHDEHYYSQLEAQKVTSYLDNEVPVVFSKCDGNTDHISHEDTRLPKTCSLLDEILESAHSEGEGVNSVSKLSSLHKGTFPATSQSEDAYSVTTSDAESNSVDGKNGAKRSQRRYSIARRPSNMTMSSISMTRSVNGRNSNRDPNGIPCPERIFKVVIIGESGVGKSCFIHRYCHGYFVPSFNSTIGVDFHMKSVLVGDRTVCLQLWDTAGQERFHSITTQYYRKADGVLIMYDVNWEHSFKSARNWITNVKNDSGDEVLLMLIGNKVDMCEKSVKLVQTSDGQRLAEEEGALFMETSAKTGLGVSEAFFMMASLLREKQDVEIARAITLTRGNNTKSKKKCGCS